MTDSRHRRSDRAWGSTDGSADSRRLRKNAHPFLYAFIIFLCLVLLCGVFIVAAPQLLGIYWQDLPNFAFVDGQILTYNGAEADNFRLWQEYLEQDILFPEIYIDDIRVSGMTLDEAARQIANVDASHRNSFSVTIVAGNKSWTLDSSNVPLLRNTEEVLNQAYALGRQTDASASETPLVQRFHAVQEMAGNPRRLYTTATYDREAVRSLVAEIAAYINREPVNAQLVSFDFNTHTFAFSDESDGCSIDEAAVYDRVIALLDAGSYGETVQVQVNITKPSVTKLELMNSYTLITSFTTETTADANRNTNIALAAQALNGKTLMPGQTLSFNETTGQRTLQKGYKEAGAISGGKTVQEVGGGVCQLATTLFNAVLRADLQIVKRSPHAWPSSYVPKGEDATVNWPGVDFSFRNNRDTPIFIVARYANRQVTVELYGVTLGDGVVIDLASNIIRTTQPTGNSTRVYNPSLTPGTSKVTVQKRTGYVLDTYKVWYKYGTEIKREYAYQTEYKAYEATVEYNN